MENNGWQILRMLSILNDSRYQEYIKDIFKEYVQCVQVAVHNCCSIINMRSASQYDSEEIFYQMVLINIMFPSWLRWWLVCLLVQLTESPPPCCQIILSESTQNYRNCRKKIQLWTLEYLQQERVMCSVCLFCNAHRSIMPQHYANLMNIVVHY